MKTYIANINNSSIDIDFRSSNRTKAKRIALGYARGNVFDGGNINVSIHDEYGNVLYLCNVERKHNKFHYYCFKNF